MNEMAAPRVTFGMIVLNGEPFLKYNLRALYPFAHQIIVVEGSSPKAADSATEDGHSLDDTLSVVRNFIAHEDPQRKVILVTAEDEGHANGFWPGDKDEQSQAYAVRATGDWLWQIDVDEFYQPEEMRAVLAYLAAHYEITCLTFQAFHFWGGFDSTVTGGLFVSKAFQGEESGAYRRVFRWGPGYSYQTHRPPTVRDQAGITSDKVKVNFTRIHPEARMYHYFMVFSTQAIRKGQYYDRMGWKHEAQVEERYRRLFARLTKEDRFHIFTHRGTRNWLERFAGEHPPAMRELIAAVRSGAEPFTLRDQSDIQALLSAPDYPFWRGLWFAVEWTRAKVESWIGRLKKMIKKILASISKANLTGDKRR